MNFQVIGRPPAKEEVRKHFFALVDCLEREGVQDIAVMFGFAWANSVYPGQWEDIRCTPAEARESVLKAESDKLGRIGTDDFYVTLPKEGLEWQYCHEADITSLAMSRIRCCYERRKNGSPKAGKYSDENQPKQGATAQRE